MRSPENIVVIHLSATAVYAVIGNIVNVDDIRIMGLSEVKISDFYQGHIMNQSRLKRAIKQAIEEASEMANMRVHSVWLSFSSPELRSTNSFGRINIEGEAISVRDIVNALGQAKQRDMPKDHYLMQHVQQGVYVNDDSHLLEDPIGTYADTLTVMYHLMMLPVRSRQNLEELFRPDNLKVDHVRVDHMIFDAVSSAEYSLLPEDRELGVCFVDIGYSSTSVCVYKEGKLVFTSCIAHGAHEVTMDISADLGLTMLEAEQLKKRHGTVDVKNVDAAQFRTVKRQSAHTSPLSQTDEITVNLHELASIIEARYVEIYTEIFSQLEEANLTDFIDRGIVLSGGGSNMRGLTQFSKRLLNMPVSLTNQHPAISASNHFEDNETYQKVTRMIEDSNFHTAFGTLLYSQSDQFRYSERSSVEALKHSQKTVNVLNKFHEWLKRVM